MDPVSLILLHVCCTPSRLPSTISRYDTNASTPHNNRKGAVRRMDENLAGRKAQQARVMSKEGQELLDRLLLVTGKYPRDEAIERFLHKVHKEQVSKPAVNWAFGHAAGEGAAFSVIVEATATLDMTPPPHWPSSEGEPPKRTSTSDPRR